jgi:type I restriction enzyme, R subunit
VTFPHAGPGRSSSRIRGPDLCGRLRLTAEDDPELHGPGGEYRRSKREMKEIAKDFKNEDDPLRIVVVHDMWLVCFDAPIMHTIYIDKPMKDHGLLQAIARVNRVFRDKPGGLVVDYIGIGELQSASAAEGISVPPRGSA